MSPQTEPRAAVLGSPIAHSKSPALHRAAYRALQLPWTYDAIDVPSGTLPAFQAALVGDWRGLSLTMPLKREVFDLLDSVSDLAKEAQAVNTVMIKGGTWHGENTDVAGMVDAISAHNRRIDTVVILGTGATARSAVLATELLGAEHVEVWGRRAEGVEDLANLARRHGLNVRAASGADHPSVNTVDLVISTLPGDAGQMWCSAVDEPRGILLDAAYDPWPPPLTAAWPADRRVTGLDLLLHQAAHQVTLMTGLPAPIEVMRTALFSTDVLAALDGEAPAP
jgi:shikimate dehydrogenase